MNYEERAREISNSWEDAIFFEFALTDRIKPEFKKTAKLPIKDKYHDYSLLLGFKDEYWGVKAKLYHNYDPFNWLHDDKPKAEKMLTAEQVKAEDKKFEEECNKPLDTSNWINVSKDDMRAEIARIYLTHSIEIERENDKLDIRDIGKGYSAGKIKALLWCIHAREPPQRKRVTWCSFGGPFAGAIGACEIMQGKKMVEYWNKVMDGARKDLTQEERFEGYKQEIDDFLHSMVEEVGYE
jgi:hypothetical protein